MSPPAHGQGGGAEAAISWVLRVGVTASLVTISLGTVLSFLRHGGYGATPRDVARLSGSGGAFPATASWLLGGLRHMDGQAVIVAGMLLLIATPVLRVAVALGTFAWSRERDYVAITGAVLALLILSFVLGKAG